MIKDKEDKTPILSLEFSKEAKMLAVSYGLYFIFLVLFDFFKIMRGQVLMFLILSLKEKAVISACL